MFDPSKKNLGGEFYRYLLLSLIAAVIATLLVSIGKYSSFSSGISHAYHNYFLKNLTVTIAAAIVSLSPVIFSIVFKLLTLAFPSHIKATPHIEKSKKVLAQILGLMVGVIAVLVVLLANGDRSGLVKSLVIAVSVLWLLAVSVAMYSSRVVKE